MVKMLINHDKPLDFKGIYPFSEQSTRGPKQPPVGVWASASSSAGPSLWVPASPWHSLEVAHCRLGKSCRKPWVKKLFLSLSLSLSLCLFGDVCVCVSSFHFWCCLFLFFFPRFLPSVGYFKETGMNHRQSCQSAFGSAVKHLKISS